MAGCEVTIEVPDALAASLIEIELQRRGLPVAHNGDRLATEVTDRASGDALAAAISAIAQGAKVAVDGGAPVPTNGNDTGAGGFALVVGPSAQRRDKWDATLRRIKAQIGRDSGKPVRRNGASFSVAGFEDRDAAVRAAAAVSKGLDAKLNFEDAGVAIVPESASELVLNVEGDRRQLLMQVGYTTESAWLLQIRIPDPAARAKLAAALASAGLELAVSDERLVAGFSSAEEAHALLARLELPAGAAVGVTMATATIDVTPGGV